MPPKKEHPLRAYIVASQLTFSILGPLLVFIVGGYYAVDYFKLPDYTMGILVAIGIITMLSGASATLSQLIRTYGKDDKKNYSRSYGNPRDNDYYDDYKKLRK